MRVNLYDHEAKYMASRHEVIRKIADTEIVFFGVRFYTEPPLMHQPGDDDSSAITFWVPWTKAKGHQTQLLREVAQTLLAACDEIDGID